MHSDLHLQCIKACFEAHKGQTRGHDKNSPYAVHPCLLAMSIAEDSLGVTDSDERDSLVRLAYVHDIIEDTTVPADTLSMLNESEKSILLNWLTIEGSSQDEYEFLKAQDPAKVPQSVWYIKAIDKSINLSNDSYFVKKGTLKQYISYTRFYLEQALKHYPNSFWLNAFSAHLDRKYL